MTLNKSTQKDSNIHLDLLKKIGKLFSENNIHYALYGSLAFNILTNSDKSVSDIDIIVYKKDFPQIKALLKERITEVIPIQTDHSIHVNHKIYLGQDGKPFDISLDSYEHYFKKQGLDLKNTNKISIKGTEIRVLSPEELLVSYEIATNGPNVHKHTEYLRKRDVLKGMIKVTSAS